MGNKPLWLRILLDTIGIPSIIALVIGVPAMILFIQSIWSGLGSSQRISAIVFGTILLLAVILFVYARTRKVLLVIPGLLQKIHNITFEAAMKINVDLEENAVRIGQLLGIDIFEHSSEEEATSNPTEIMYEKVKDMLASDEQANERMANLLVSDIGLRDILNNDNRYIATNAKLDKARQLIPTEEIASTVNSYLNMVELIGSTLPLIQAITTIKYDAIKMEADLAGIENKIKDGMLVQLARVRDPITKYYKGEK